MKTSESRKIPLAVLLILTVLGSALGVLPAPAFATPGGTAWCNHTITASTTLTANIGPCAGNGLVIGHNGITLNCNGHTITGKSTNTHAGIYLSGRTKVTVKNCHVTAFRYGFYLYHSSHNTFTENTANNNNQDGFDLASSSYDTFTANTANNNHHDGFGLTRSSYNTLVQNTANSDGDGFVLSTSPHNVLGTSAALSGNTANNNKQFGFYLWSSSYNTFTADTASGNIGNGFILYGGSNNYNGGSNNNNLTKNTASANMGGGVRLDSSYDNVFRGNTANSNNGWGFDFDCANLAVARRNNTLTGNTADNNGYGFSLFGFSGTLSRNIAYSNRQDGFLLLLASNDTLTGNVANLNRQYGFYLNDSSHENLTKNVANRNHKSGFYLGSSTGYENLSNNSADYNTQYGYYDVTTGSGTGGTANVYSGDACGVDSLGGSNPTGLCVSRSVSILVTVYPTAAGTYATFNWATVVPVQIIFTAVPVGTPPFTYLWSFGDGTSSTSSSPTHVFLSGSSYKVTLNVTDGIGQKSSWKALFNIFP